MQRNVKKYVAMQRAYTDDLNRQLGVKLAARRLISRRGRLDFRAKLGAASTSAGRASSGRPPGAARARVGSR